MSAELGGFFLLEHTHPGDMDSLVLDLGLDAIPAAPALLLVGVAAYVVAVAGATLLGLAAGMKRAGFPVERQLTLNRRVGGGLALWFLILTMSTLSGAYLETRAPRFLLYAVPALLSVAALARAPWLKASVEAMPRWWIPALQTLRVGGGTTLFAGWAIGLAPWGFVRIAGTGDILVGVLAAAVAFALARRLTAARALAVVWNALGLLDILHTLFRAVTSAPGPQRLFFEEPANLVPLVFPFVYLPGFIVPLTVLLHVLSLRQLRVQRTPA
jgi:hypothetical protein